MALVIAALGSGHKGSPENTSTGPSSYSTPAGVSDDTSVDAAAQLERQRQAVQALQDGSQQSFDAAMNTANSITP